MRPGDVREVQSSWDEQVAGSFCVAVLKEGNMVATSLLLDGTSLKYRELFCYSIDISSFVFRLDGNGERVGDSELSTVEKLL